MRSQFFYIAIISQILFITSLAQTINEPTFQSLNTDIIFTNKLDSVDQKDGQKRFAASGYIYDSETKNPLPNANLRIIGTNKGTSTNKVGNFRLLLEPGLYKLAVSYIGYHSDTISVIVVDSNIEKAIYLKPSTLLLQEVIVYSEKFNPAEEIILKAIEKKKDVLSQLRSFQFNAYTKTSFRVIKDTTNQADTIIAGILETQTNGYWNFPNQYKEIITARRQTANFPPAQNIFTLGRIPNLNDDIVVIEQHSIISPTNPKALENYSFEMIDTLAMDNIPIYRIRIKPKSKLKPLFDGTTSIADKSFLVNQVDVYGNEALNLDPLHDIRIQQQFALFEEKFWLPVESRITYNVHFAFIPSSPILWEQYSMIYNYHINVGVQDSIFDRYTVSALPTASNIDDKRWSQSDILPLTNDEVNAYHRIDSIMQKTNIFQKTILFLIQLPQTMKELPFTTFSDFFRFNRVEGFYLGIGMKFDNLLPFTNFKLRTGYGFSDKKLKYSFETEQYLTHQRKTSLGLKFFNKTQYREGEEFFSRGIITLTTLLNKNDPVDYFESKGLNISFWMNLFPSVNLNLSYSNEIHKSISKNSDFSIFYPSKSFRSNPTIDDGDLRSITFTFNYDTRKFIDFGIFEAEDKSQNSILVDLSIEHSNKKFLSSDFDFSRILASIQLHQLTFWSGRLKLNLKVGFSTGTLPSQRFFDLLGSYSSISPQSHLKTISVKDYSGNRMASVQLEHNFGGLIFRAIGLSFLSNIDFITYFGSGWTDFSNGALNLRSIADQPTKKVLYEAGFGLGRSLSSFRFDFTWRITMREQKNFQITLSSAL